MPGGACDGYKYDIGQAMRGGREMDPTISRSCGICSAPSSLRQREPACWTSITGANKEDPNKSLCRATVNRGQDAHTSMAIRHLRSGAMENRSSSSPRTCCQQDKKITDIFDDEVFSSNFWMCWRTMFAFENGTARWR